MNNPVNHGETITYTTDYNYYQSIRQNQCNKSSSMESTDTVSFMLVNATTQNCKIWLFDDITFFQNK